MNEMFLVLFLGLFGAQLYAQLLLAASKAHWAYHLGAGVAAAIPLLLYGVAANIETGVAVWWVLTDKLLGS